MLQIPLAVGISLAVVLLLVGNVLLFRLRGQMIKAFMLRLMHDYALGTACPSFGLLMNVIVSDLGIYRNGIQRSLAYHYMHPLL